MARNCTLKTEGEGEHREERGQRRGGERRTENKIKKIIFLFI